MKESWRFQQCDTPEQTLWQLLLPCRRLARARRELGWARSGCELWHWCSCRDKLWRLWLPDSSNHPKSQLFPLFCCRFRDPKAVQWWALSSGEVATALPLKGSISYKWWICNCLLKKLGAMLEMIKGPLDSSGLGEPFEASTLLRARWQIHAWYSPGEVKCPWASLALLGVLEGRCHILSALDSHCWKLNNGTTEVDKNFIRSRAIPI